jgi:hypothetical protein
MAAPLKCPKCKTPLNVIEGELKCIACGYVRSKTGERHEFYELHKEEIIQDFAKLGRVAMRKKWGIPPASWCQLMRRWNVSPTAVDPGMPVPPPPIPPVPHNTAGLPPFPPFPPFNEEWVSEVKIKWLDIWLRLHEMQVKNDGKKP